MTMKSSLQVSVPRPCSGIYLPLTTASKFKREIYNGTAGFIPRLGSCLQGCPEALKEGAGGERAGKREWD